MGNIQNKYETGTGNTLTLLDLPPKEGIVEIVDFVFPLPDGIDLEQFRNDLIREGKIDPNFFFQYYGHIDKEKVLTLNVSFLIYYKDYLNMMIKS